jgi:hypothetical protein
VLGPTLHYECGNADCTTAGSSIYVPYLRVGLGAQGWWNKASTGNTNSSCQFFDEDVEHNRDFYLPIYDNWIDPGNNSRFHLARIGKFRINDDDIDCQPSSDEYIDGTFEGFVDLVTGGQHGDLRATSNHTVFLDN